MPKTSTAIKADKQRSKAIGDMVVRSLCETYARYDVKQGRKIVARSLTLTQASKQFSLASVTLHPTN